MRALVASTCSTARPVCVRPAGALRGGHAVEQRLAVVQDAVLIEDDGVVAVERQLVASRLRQSSRSCAAMDDMLPARSRGAKLRAALATLAKIRGCEAHMTCATTAVRFERAC